MAELLFLSEKSHDLQQLKTGIITQTTPHENEYTNNFIEKSITHSTAANYLLFPRHYHHTGQGSHNFCVGWFTIQMRHQKSEVEIQSATDPHPWGE